MTDKEKWPKGTVDLGGMQLSPEAAAHLKANAEKERREQATLYGGLYRLECGCVVLRVPPIDGCFMVQGCEDHANEHQGLERLPPDFFKARTRLEGPRAQQFMDMLKELAELGARFQILKGLLA